MGQPNLKRTKRSDLYIVPVPIAGPFGMVNGVRFPMFGVTGTAYGYTGQLYVAFSIDEARKYRDEIELYHRRVT